MSSARTRNYRQDGSRHVEMVARFRDQMSSYARGEALRKLREAQHLSQETLASRLGVSVKSVRAWEKGGGIRWHNAKQLAEYFEVDPSVLASSEASEALEAQIEKMIPVAARPQLDRIEQKLELLVRLAMAGVPQEVRDALRFEQALEDIERESDRQDRRGLEGEDETG